MHLLETPLWELRHWVHHRLLVCVSIGGQQAQLAGARLFHWHRESLLFLGHRFGGACGAASLVASSTVGSGPSSLPTVNTPPRPMPGTK